MKLSCEASFWRNFKDSTPAQPRSRSYMASPPESPEGFLGQSQSSQPATEVSKSHTTSPPAAMPQDEIPEGEILPAQGRDVGGAATSPDTTSHPVHDDSEELLSSIGNGLIPNTDLHQVNLDDWGFFQNNLFLMPSPERFSPREWQFDQVLAAMAGENISPQCSSALCPPRVCDSYDRLAEQLGISSTQMPTTSTEQIPSNASTVTELPLSSELPAADMDSFLFSPQIPTVHTTTERHLIRHYQVYMSKFLSVKDPQWNLYTYMLHSPQGSSESPLRHSLLAWSAFHVSGVRESSSEDSAKYYHAASSAVDDLMMELASFGGSFILSERLRMLLSATFFLCYCDVMVCHPDLFYARLQSLKGALFHNWTLVSAALSPITSRLLVWISYLEIRASLWRVPGSFSDPRSPSKLLIDMLADHVSLSSFYTNSGCYLEECFGDQYPNSELKQDLQQEGGNLKLLDIMTTLCEIITFEVWDRDALSENNIVVRELRTTKIRLLQAELARIRAVRISLSISTPANLRWNR
jgi:hypothetical protein